MKKWKSNTKIILDKFFLTPLKYLIPVRKVILFESFSDFSDSSRTLFLNMLQNEKFQDYTFIWFVDDPAKYKKMYTNRVFFYKIHASGFVKLMEELRNFYLLSSSQLFYYTHRSFARTKPKYNQQFINLTHGTSLKDTRGIHPPFKFNSETAVTSEFTKNLRVISYGGGESQMKITGLPRNDELFEGITSKQRKELKLDDFDKTLLWMPTFRRQKGKNRNDTGTTSVSDIPLINSKKDWISLNSRLSESNTLLIIKPHPAQKMEYIEKVSLSHVKLMTNDDLASKEILLYNLMGEVDGLISDYSSVFIDFLILNKPIAFTVDDMEAYSENLGFSVDNPLDFMPGNKIDNINDFYEFIDDMHNNIDLWKEKREYIRNLFHEYQDNKSTERVINLTKM